MKPIRVSWQYTHHLNSKSSLERAKEGEFLGKVKHRKNHLGLQRAWVKFDGNKTISRIPFRELVFLRG